MAGIAVHGPLLSIVQRDPNEEKRQHAQELATRYPLTLNRFKLSIARDSSLLCYSFSGTANYHRIHRGTCRKPDKHSYCVCYFILDFFWNLVLEYVV